MLKYLGTPITPRPVLNDLAGMNFCVSYAAPGDIAWCDDHAQTLMLDNGAFSFWQDRQKDRPLSVKAQAAADGDWSGYYAWCQQWLERNTTWAVIPDVIGGSEDENDLLIRQWKAWRGHMQAAPVWHMHESLGRFLRLCDEWELVCVGSSAQYAIVGSPAWHKRIEEVFDVTYPNTPRLHMLRGLDFADGPYPFYSADSTNVARNHAGTNHGRARKSARRMADEINARNPARVWVPTPEQMGLVA